MKKFGAMIPIVGMVYVKVEAEDEKQAIRKVFDSEELMLENVEEWDAFEEIVTGNRINTRNNKAYAFGIND